MSTTVAPQQSLVRIGVARGDITPPVGIYHRMWGAATHDRSTGVHRPLTATAMVVQPHDADRSVKPRILVAADHCLLWTAEMRTLLDRLAERSGCDRDEITVLFSHTHAAGLMGLERGDLPGGDLIAGYLDELATETSRLITEAMANCRPATICFGKGSCTLAANRDFFDPDREQFVCGFNPKGPADSTVIVGRVSDEDGRTMSTLVNYACHPTTLAWDNTLISPDYVGAMREVIEQATDAPCFFIQGASGDLGPREGFVGDVEIADRNGRQLGYAALAAIEALCPAKQQFHYAGPVVSGATIGTWRYTAAPPSALQRAAVWRSSLCQVDLPYRDDLPRRAGLLEEQSRWQAEERAALQVDDQARARDARAMAERATRRLVRVEHLPEGDYYPYSTELWRTGDAIWVSLEGEHYQVLQRVLRDRFPDFTLIVGTLANGSTVWYLPDADSYGRGLYQEEASTLARGSLETLIDALTESIRELVD